MARKFSTGRSAALFALPSLALAAVVACATTQPAEVILDDSPYSSLGDAAEGVADPSAGDLPKRDVLAKRTVGSRARSAAVSRKLLDQARAEDAGYDALMAAARALAVDADLRVQSALAFGPDPANLSSPEALIGAEDRLPADLKAEVRSLASTSRDLADRALELRPEDPAARLYSVLGTSLVLWSQPAFQSLTSGATRTLPGRIESLAEEHPDFEGAAPLRLAGRFQSRAPWPFKDREAGCEKLARACEAAPLPLNLLFLGDAQWLCGDEELARATWRRAVAADADEQTSAAAPLIREIARLRLVSSE